MKYIWLGYIEPGKFEGMTQDERPQRSTNALSQRPSAPNGHFPPKYLFSGPPVAGEGARATQAKQIPPGSAPVRNDNRMRSKSKGSDLRLYAAFGLGVIFRSSRRRA